MRFSFIIALFPLAFAAPAKRQLDSLLGGATGTGTGTTAAGGAGGLESLLGGLTGTETGATGATGTGAAAGGDLLKGVELPIKAKIGVVNLE